MIRTKLILMLVVLVAVAMSYAEDRLPGGDWTVRFHLYQAEGFDSIPMRVIGVKSEGNRGLTRVELRNRSTKPVTAVRIGWYVSTERGPGTILANGETPLLSLPSTLNANEDLQFGLPPISLAKILKPAVKRNTLRGDFSVQVAVTEIVYEDKSTWKFSQPVNVAPIKVQYAHALLACGQTCRWIPESGYVCESVAQNVTCTVMGDSCIVQSCSGSGD